MQTLLIREGFEMAKTNSITKEELFDLVAPIHIYQKADLMYEKEAREAFSSLKRVRHHKLVSTYFGEGSEIFRERTVRNVDCMTFWKVYNQLFKEIVQEKFPKWRTDHDYYGARCFNFDGLTLLAGDSYDCFPFYLDYEALKERLNDFAKVA
jgi:hypothetical protein